MGKGTTREDRVCVVFLKKVHKVGQGTTLEDKCASCSSKKLIKWVTVRPGEERMLRASFLQKKCVESIDSSTGTQAIVAFVEVGDDVVDGTVLMMVLYFYRTPDGPD